MALVSSTRLVALQLVIVGALYAQQLKALEALLCEADEAGIRFRFRLAENENPPAELVQWNRETMKGVADVLIEVLREQGREDLLP